MVATVELRFSVTHPLNELQSSILEDNNISSKNQETTPILNVMMEHSNVLKSLSICLDLYTQKFHQISMELHELASCMADQFPETKKSAEALLLLDGIVFDVQGLFMGSEEKFSISSTLSFDMSKTKVVISPTLKTDIMSTAEVEKGPTNDVNGVNKVLCFPFANLTIVQIIGRLQSMIIEAQQIVQQEIEPLAARLTDCTNSNYSNVNETEYMVAIQQEATNYTTNIKRAMTVLNETINSLQANMTDCMGILDCNGQCNGTSRLQEICHHISYGKKGTTDRNETEYPDCSVTLEMKALYNNGKCYACISMEKLSAVGKDACGVCGGDNSTCMGCDGVPNRSIGKWILGLKIQRL
ncbi:hypothetical protein CHS0354_031870 [Potamilus streckersoni]|uniref:Uncharacterized protein n=1 Tax=Potamilus streckersoni TaxID=2493646 RepID=A0AAE0RXU8_9BIVA|nr:hypothetical protein CHS0354_031870 [Potamilus streckersoni]